ncbi:MAG: KH domain-containing protein [Acidimicrobiaceae bacterium]|nr:KH domain-containing protein [Acidimicrobiaceae bacterium]
MSDLAPTAQAMCRHVVASIVDDTDAVQVTASPAGPDAVRLDVRVAQGEMGRVIGKRGRVAHAIRTLVRAAGSRDDVDVEVEFVD